MEKFKFETEQEWLAFRKQKLGASDAPTIMGTAHWKLQDGRIKTPYLLWQEKLGLLDTSIDNVAVRYGKNMEDAAREAYQVVAGDLFEPTVVLNPKYPYLMASLDGLNVTDDHAVEIKNANAEDHELAKSGKVPDKYFPQVQMQIMVTELPSIDYWSFHKGEGVLVVVKKDEEYQKLLDEKLYHFWECVTNLKEPELTDDDFIERSGEWFTIAKSLWKIKQEKKALEVEEKALEQMLKDYSEGQNSRAGGFRYTVSNMIGRVNYKAIPELENVDLDKYRGKSIQSWRLKKEKD